MGRKELDKLAEELFNSMSVEKRIECLYDIMSHMATALGNTIEVIEKLEKRIAELED